MTFKTVFLFDDITGEYKGPYDAQESPEEPGEFITPICSLEAEPPACGSREVAVALSGIWTVTPDFRGVQLFSTVDGSPVAVEAIGPQPEGTTEAVRPSASHHWNGSAWALSLQALKSAKNAEINAARLAANQSTFTHAGKQIACDLLSRSDIDGTNGEILNRGAMPDGWPGGWKAVDNSYLTIADVLAWKDFYSSMFATGNANFAHAQTLKATLEAATTAEQVAAITW